MTVPIEIKIPTASISNDPKPHTVYHISLRLPLQSFTLEKRYSEFTALHTTLAAQAGTAPPCELPPKTYFSSTTHNAALTETRRQGLEKYLQAINAHPSAQWRDTPAWRTFLNLPSNLSSKSSTATSLRSLPNASSVADPAVWLDTHRELKALLQEARLHVAARDKAESITATHEQRTEAKKALVRAGTLIATLDQGLKARGEEWGRERLGEGELRRRRDLVSSARKEKDDLENLLTAMAKKKELDDMVESKIVLTSSGSGTERSGAAVGKGRVLGKETAKTRELDNRGVLQLQQQLMREQDEDLDVIAAAVRRQKELALQINEELEVQKDLLTLLDEDVDRVGGKIKIAGKRMDKIR
jgi:regulator of vacuolar morphogenesis